jgi:hypothetical protein
LEIVGYQRDSKHWPLKFSDDDIRWAQAVAQLVRLGMSPAALQQAMARGTTIGWLRTVSAAAECLAEAWKLRSEGLPEPTTHVTSDLLAGVSQHAQ